jgi:hypothetical protein
MNDAPVGDEPNPNRLWVASESKPNQVRVESESLPAHIDRTRLTPKVPPGRSNRKVRSFELQIAQLCIQGYTLEAIRDALAEVGVRVSKSAVQREAARSAKARRQVTGAGHPAGPGRVTTQSPVATAAALAGPTRRLESLPTRPDERSGKDIAEAFMRDRITNPLLRNRS